MDIITYVRDLTNRIFKALPLREDGIAIECLMQYLSALYIDALGYQISRPELQKDRDFQIVVNILACLGTTEVSEKVWRSEILTATHSLNVVEKRFGGDNHD